MRPFFFDRQQMAGGIRLRCGRTRGRQPGGFLPLVNHPLSLVPKMAPGVLCAPTSYRDRCERNTRGRSGGHLRRWFCLLLPEKWVHPVWGECWSVRWKGGCILSSAGFGGARRKVVLFLRTGWQSETGTFPLRTTRALKKGSGVIRKRGETIGLSPFVRLRRAAAHFVCFGKSTPPAVGNRTPRRADNISLSLPKHKKRTACRRFFFVCLETDGSLF